MSHILDNGETITGKAWLEIEDKLIDKNKRIRMLEDEIAYINLALSQLNDKLDEINACGGGLEIDKVFNPKYYAN